MESLPFVEVGGSFVPFIHKLSDAELKHLVGKYEDELRELCGSERQYNIYKAVFLYAKIADQKMNKLFETK